MEKVMNNKQLTKAIHDLLSQQEQIITLLRSMLNTSEMTIKSIDLLKNLQKKESDNGTNGRNQQNTQ
jgi:hypothetical protein